MTNHDQLKRLGESAVAAAAVWALLAGIFMGIVWLTNGHFPPWATPDEVSRIVTAKVHDGTVSLQAYVDYHDCGDYNDRFSRAQQALQRNPNDLVARDLFNASIEKIRTIPNCMANVLPSQPPLDPPARPGGTLIVP